jgi:hypothetical protein
LYRFCRFPFIVEYCAFVVWKILGESLVYFRFTDGASRHTLDLDSTTWETYSPTNLLVFSRGVYLGESTNNIVEYRAIIDIL